MLKDTTKHFLRAPLGLNLNWSEDKNHLGGFLWSTSLTGSCFDSFLARDWYVVLGPTPVADVLPELYPFAVKDLCVEWPMLG